jgi:hypothetical protein
VYIRKKEKGEWSEDLGSNNTSEGGVKLQAGKRVGSSLEVHASSSLAFGAASACELDAVNSVNENGFWTASVSRFSRGKLAA